MFSLSPTIKQFIQAGKYCKHNKIKLFQPLEGNHAENVNSSWQCVLLTRWLTWKNMPPPLTVVGAADEVE